MFFGKIIKWFDYQAKAIGSIPNNGSLSLLIFMNSSIMNNLDGFEKPGIDDFVLRCPNSGMIEISQLFKHTSMSVH